MGKRVSKIYAKSIQGGRDYNEDSFGFDLERGIMFVADGLGGHAAGEIASTMLKDFLLKNYNGNPSKIPELLKRANAAIFNEAQLDSEKAGMGTTVVISAIHNGKIYVFWSGDSMAYLIRGDKIKALVTPHSAGEHQITSAIGVFAEIPEIGKAAHELEKGDIVILCSDGLSDWLSENQIKDIAIENIKDSEFVCEALVQRADEIGAARTHSQHDNITVIVYRHE